MLTARRDEEMEMERRREPLMPAPLLAGYEKAKERILSLQGATRDLQPHIAKGKEEKAMILLSLKGTCRNWRHRMLG